MSLPVQGGGAAADAVPAAEADGLPDDAGSPPPHPASQTIARRLGAHTAVSYNAIPPEPAKAFIERLGHTPTHTR